MRLLSIAMCFVALWATYTFAQTQYLIRHGEKPCCDKEHLSKEGRERAHCLTKVFGKRSQYGIGYMMAEKFKENGERTRPFETVQPLWNSLTNMTLDIHCDRDDADCVAKRVHEYQKTHDDAVLICWEHGQLTAIATALGVEHPLKYPDSHFDLIWTIKDGVFVSNTSESCPGLDSGGEDYLVSQYM